MGGLRVLLGTLVTLGAFAACVGGEPDIDSSTTSPATDAGTTDGGPAGAPTAARPARRAEDASGSPAIS